MLGDFNAVLSQEDRFQGRTITTYETQDFTDCLHNSDLLELKSCGNFFSWNNKSHGVSRVLSRIDKCLVNSTWIVKYTGVVVEYLNPGISDHSPLLLKCSAPQGQCGRPFKFFNYIADHDEFGTLITDTWNDFENASWMEQE